ncbi:MAG: PAS domain-containing protein, partial [Clostridia bacterium]
MASKWFVRKAYTVSFDSSANEVWSIMSRYNEPYVFITDPSSPERIVAFIRNTDIIPFFDNTEWMKRTVRELPYHTHLISIQRGADMLDFFKVFGEEAVVILNQEGTYEGYLQREDILAYLLTNQSTDWIRSLLNSIPMGILIADVHGRIENFSQEALRMIRVEPDEVRQLGINDLLDAEVFGKVVENGETILNHIIVNDRLAVLADFGPIRNQYGKVTGVIIVLQDLPYIENMAMELEYVKNLNMDMQAILSSIYDENLVVDSKG